MRSLPLTVNKEQAARRLFRALHCFPNFSSDVVLSLGKAKCTVIPQCNAASSGVDEGDSPEQAKLDAFCSAGSEENSRQWNRTTDMDGLGSGVIPPAFAAPRTSRILWLRPTVSGSSWSAPSRSYTGKPPPDKLIQPPAIAIHAILHIRCLTPVVTASLQYRLEGLAEGLFCRAVGCFFVQALCQLTCLSDGECSTTGVLTLYRPPFPASDAEGCVAEQQESDTTQMLRTE